MRAGELRVGLSCARKGKVSMPEWTYYAIALFVGWLVWLVLSEISHRRYIRAYREQTERLYGRRDA